MVNPQLLDYIKQQLAQGLSKEAIFTNLASSGGWNPADINEAFSAVGINISNAPGISETMPIVPVKYAGFWIRWVAVTVDGIILLPVGFLVGLIFGIITAIIGPNKNLNFILSSVIGLLINWSYFVLMTYYKGATLGKILVGINVKSDDFQELSFKKIILRETIGKFISLIFLSIGYIMAGFTQKKQAFHDKFARTVVVYKDPSKPHRAGLIVGVIMAAILPALIIMGILASIVLASLNTARHKSQDAKTKADLSQMAVSAEIYYGKNGNSYSQAKSCNSGMFLEQNMQQSIFDIASKVATCYAEGATFAISAKLSDPAQSYCVDNSGYGGDGIAVDNGSVASCQMIESSIQK